MWQSSKYRVIAVCLFIYVKSMPLYAGDKVEQIVTDPNGSLSATEKSTVMEKESLGSLSSVIRLDIGANAKRNDTGAMKWQEWPVDNNVNSSQLKVGDVTITLRSIGASILESKISKIELAYNAQLACDGVFINEPKKDTALEVAIQGLAAGPHTVTTYHNSLWPKKTVGQYRISIVGTTHEAAVSPPKDVKHDDDVSSTHMSFVAPESGEVLIHIESAAPGDANNIILNGLMIDGQDPKRQVRKPVPIDGDEHVDGDNGYVELGWTPTQGAKAYHVYVSCSHKLEEAVEALSITTPEHSLLIGTVAEPRFSADIVDNDSLLHYAWRVDEVNADNVVTPGRVWTFRVRHLAFPGAEGYGRFALGGRGGRVFRVTQLGDSGPGSLREAVEAKGPRTVVFEVGGLISLKSRLLIRNPYITIAGQTAPGKGICVRNYSFGGFGSHDIIKRFVRIRLGDLAGHSMDGTGLASCDNSIFDHLSISWTLDEAVSTRGAGNITLQRTIISEALLNAPKYSGGYAGSIGGDVASLHHNLLSHNAGRNWSLAGALDQAGHHQGRLDIRNNVVYNWYKRTCDGGAMIVQFVNNYYKPGPASVVFHVLMPERNNIAGFGPQDYYVSGNIMEGKYSADEAWGGIVKPKDEELSAFIYPKPFFEPYVTTQTAAEAFENVLGDVGCNVPMLDEHDQRIIRETRTNTTSSIGSLTKTPGVINTQKDVGGWDEYPEVHRPEGWDTDGDGIPNAWETEHGLNPENAADGALYRDGDGYTALEDYLNSLI
ncbi:MAG: hypothetical protein JW715_14860 [Sedimentisphaerales bacterium]|nr:hypothetical protein [Sedimentisphaerales bacterium]